MNDSLKVLLDNISPGLYSIETNNLKTVKECIAEIAGRFHTLVIDFSVDDVNYYNRNIDKGFEAVILHSFRELKNANAVLSSCNFNRDNFINKGIPIFFIISTGVKKLLRTDFPNLDSYFMVSVDLTEKLEIPFKYVMSLDRLIFTDSLVSFNYMRNLKISEIIKSDRNLMAIIRTRYDETIRVNTRCGICEDDLDSKALRNFFDDVILLNHILLYGNRYTEVFRNAAETIKIVIGMSVTGSNDIDFEELSIWIYGLHCEVVPYDNTIREQLVMLLRQFATAAFYIKDYGFAAFVFSHLLEWLETFDVSTMTDEDLNAKMLVQMDYIICTKKTYPQDIYLHNIRVFLNRQIQRKMSFNVEYVYRYNRLLFALITDSPFDADEELKYFKKLQDTLPNNNPLVLRYSTLVAWMLGCDIGYVPRALGLLHSTLSLAREVFPENYYVIAEMNFCEGVLFWLVDLQDLAKRTIRKAINILNNSKKSNKQTIEVMTEFLESRLR